MDLRQLSDALAVVRRSIDEDSPVRSIPPRGWINTIRRALGMRSAQLARRLGVSQPSVVRAEERELDGSMSIDTMRRFAAELDCEVVYFLLPRTSLLEAVSRRAEQIARAESASIARSLGLEWQVVPTPAVGAQIDRLKAELIAQRPARLWDLTDAGPAE